MSGLLESMASSPWLFSRLLGFGLRSHWALGWPRSGPPSLRLSSTLLWCFRFSCSGLPLPCTPGQASSADCVPGQHFSSLVVVLGKEVLSLSHRESFVHLTSSGINPPALIFFSQGEGRVPLCRQLSSQSMWRAALRLPAHLSASQVIPDCQRFTVLGPSSLKCLLA